MFPNILAAPIAPDTAPLATAEGAELEGDTDSLNAANALGGSETKDDGEGFCVLESAPSGHRFRLSILQPSEPRTFYSAVKREIKLLKSDLPPGVCISWSCYFISINNNKKCLYNTGD